MSSDPTFGAILEDSAAQYGNAIALVNGSQQLCYQELHAEVSRVAKGYVAMGLAPRDRVAIFLDSGIEAVVAIFAAWRAGLIAVPVNPKLKPHQLAHILDDCVPEVLVTSQWRQQLLALQFRFAKPRVVTSLGEFVSGGGVALHRSIDLDAAAILYTSGSTGPPKGVVVSHRNLTSGAASVVEYLGLASDDVILATLPLSFDAGLSQVTTGIKSGAAVVLHTYLRPNDLAATCGRHRVTSITAVPPLWRQIVNAEWTAEASGTIRRIANTGGHMTASLLEQLRGTFPAAQPFLMYGLTEAFRSTYLDPSHIDERPGSIGKAIPNNEILVLDEDGNPCLPGQLGELVHRGATVALGYWNRPEETAERFRLLPNRQCGLLPEYAVWSGDLVRVDQEGYVYFHGRRDELIKSWGYRVSPAEIESVLSRAPGVVENAVFGHQDDELGQRIVGAVVLTGGARLEEVRSYATRELPDYMLPVVWELPELPRSSNGKIDRQALRSRYSAMSTQCRMRDGP